jgi:hypothetical protein
MKDPKVGMRVRLTGMGAIPCGHAIGTIVKVTAMKIPVGGSRHRCKVRWDSGATSTADERALDEVAE